MQRAPCVCVSCARARARVCVGAGAATHHTHTYGCSPVLRSVRGARTTAPMLDRVRDREAPVENDRWVLECQKRVPSVWVSCVRVPVCAGAATHHAHTMAAHQCCVPSPMPTADVRLSRTKGRLLECQESAASAFRARVLCVCIYRTVRTEASPFHWLCESV